MGGRHFKSHRVAKLLRELCHLFLKLMRMSFYEQVWVKPFQGSCHTLEYVYLTTINIYLHNIYRRDLTGVNKTIYRNRVCRFVFLSADKRLVSCQGRERQCLV